MLSIKELWVSVGDKTVLKGLNLQVDGGVHVIMGPNGSGKSTLANIIAGRDGYNIDDGQIIYEGRNITTEEPEMRARNGIFLAFQYPVEIPGVNNIYLLKAALNALRKHRGEEQLDAVEFLSLIKDKMKMVDMSEDLLNRPINEGFSGGEKKRNEIFQMSVMQPKLAVLDEVDSGLDIDALKTVADGINQLRDAKRTIILVTHYQRLLNYVVPDHVHVLFDGRVIKSGGHELAQELEEKGYNWVTGGRKKA